MAVVFRVKGSFAKTRKFFKSSRGFERKFRTIMNKYGKLGIKALIKYTPKDSGITAASWTYVVEKTRLTFRNSNTVDGVSVVVFIQYGHVVPGGGYVSPVDFINPALKPIFDKISIQCWKEVEKA